MQFGDLLGKTLTEVTIDDDDEIIFKTSDGDTYRLYHEQDCCEWVYVESVVGDIQDLIGTPILLAEEVSGETAQPVGWMPNAYMDDSFTWTFYKLATIKGYVDIRWFGSSNGYYSERVTFAKD